MVESESPGRVPLHDGSESDDCEVGEVDQRQGVAPFGCTRRRGLWSAGLSLLAVAAVAIGTSRTTAWGRLTGQRLGIASGGNVISLFTEPFDCNAGLENWDAGWAVAKKRWCCSNKELGCPEVNHVSVTFVVAHIKFMEITGEPHKDVMEELLHLVKEHVANHAQNQVQLTDVSLSYWEGSGLHTTVASDSALGMVIRARIAVPSATLVDAVIARFEQAGFKSQVAEDIGNLNGIHDVSIPPISVQDLVIEQKIVDQCTCPNGWPQEGDACPPYGGKVCKDCYPGFHMTSGALCEPNDCSCPNGNKATGQLCEKHLSTKCSSCSLGYHMDGLDKTACLPNYCTCANGTAATAAACYEDKAQICTDCAQGFHVNSTTRSCQENVCTCSDLGVPATGPDCTKHLATICQACVAGYHLSDAFKCERNKCTCSHGEAAIGTLCDRHGAEVCAYCDPGLHLHTDGTCGEKRCLCPNGEAATGDECDTHRAIYCMKCNAGYFRNSHQCVSEGCQCDNGVAADGDACPVAGFSKCVSCHSGYTLENGVCKANKCTCEFGEPAVGAQCRATGVTSCGRCNDGYRHQLKTVYDGDGAKLTIDCIPNVCHCTHNDRVVGIPAMPNTTVKCHTDGGNICSECTPGENYYLDTGTIIDDDGKSTAIDHQCLPNECKCAGGIPVRTKKCPANGMEFCASCNEGYFETTEVLTSYERGLGSIPPDASKYTDGAMICVHSEFTTTLPFECSKTQKNWETAWSQTKKHWCCKELGIGCVPTATESDLCINDAFNVEQCRLVGCCKWNAGKQKCEPADGNGERVCHPEFNIKISGGKCLTATEQGATLDPIIDLEECDFKNSGQDWSPMVTGQIRDQDGMCLHVKEDELAGQLTIKACSEDTPVDDAQYFFRDATTMQLRSKKGYCLSAQDDSVILGECQATNPLQQWVVPAVNR